MSDYFIGFHRFKPHTRNRPRFADEHPAAPGFDAPPAPPSFPDRVVRLILAHRRQCPPRPGRKQVSIQAVRLGAERFEELCRQHGTPTMGE